MRELSRSDKNLREHAHVAHAIEGALRPLAREVRVPARPVVRSLRNVHHLWTPISATLAAPLHALDLVAALHPTPAVCGTPRRAAIEWIAAHEPSPRGWYAGAVGWFRRRGRRRVLGGDPLRRAHPPRGLALRGRGHRRGLGSQRRVRRDPGQADADARGAGALAVSRSNLHLAWARLFLRAAAAAGVTDVVLSPGSRSTPLTIAAATTSELRAHVIVDERSAAFFALGQARVTGRPSLLICTSGTAGAHWLPALIEASQSFVPLIAVTADRPWELQDSAAPQTIDQLKLFGDHVRHYAELGLPILRPARCAQCRGSPRRPWRARSARSLDPSTSTLAFASRSSPSRSTDLRPGSRSSTR